jgi:hypothetical protein
VQKNADICLVTIKMKRYIYRVKIAETNRN